MLEDDAQFEKQRRNVMVAGTVYLALRFSQIPMTRFLPGQLQAPVSLESIWRLQLLWAIAILYFMWRLYQVSHDVRAKRREKWQSAVTVSITRRLFASPEVGELRAAIAAENANLGNGLPVSAVEINTDRLEITNKQKDVTYKLLANITWKSSTENLSANSMNKRYEVTIEHGGRTWIRAAIAAYTTLALKTTYFTQYTLAYTIGYAAVGLAIYDVGTYLFRA